MLTKFYFKELLIRSYYTVIYWIVLLCLSYSKKEALLIMILAPFFKFEILCLHPLDLLYVYFLQSVIISTLLTFPYLTLQIYLYLAPSLYNFELSLLTKKIKTSLILLASTLISTHFLIFPYLISTLPSLSGINLEFSLWKITQWHWICNLLAISYMFILKIGQTSLNFNKVRSFIYLGNSLSLSFIAPSDTTFLIGFILINGIYELFLYISLWKQHEYIGTRTQNLQVKSQ